MRTSSGYLAAAAQFFSGTDPAANLALCERFLRDAASAGARLVVLPENSNRVRDYASREECFARAERLDGPFVTGLAAICADLGIHAVVGVDERGKEAPDVYIASILFDPQGEILHVHHKHTLWDYEYTLFTPGTEPYRVVDTELGRLGLQICADGIVPETPRILALLGAQVLCNSLNSRGPDELRVHVPLRAMENRVWHISANTVGGPSDQWPWMGGSQIVGPDGRVLIAASESAEEFVIAEIRPAVADDKATPIVRDIFSWRRPELYADLGLPLDAVPVASMYGPAPDTPARPLQVALLQLSWNHSREWTMRRALAEVEYAARRGAALGVFPELFCFARDEVAADPAEAAAYSEIVLALLREAARSHRIWLAVNLAEGADGAYFSTTFLVSDTGDVVTAYRKAHLDEAETKWASAGNELVVTETPFGRIGLITGSEVWIPEVMRVLAVRGAEIVLHPCDWDRPEAADIAACERTEENRVHLVSVTRLDSPGRRGSQVTRADPFEPGQPIAVMRYPTGYFTRGGFEEQLIVTLDLRESNDKMMGLHLDPLATRQPALYGAMLTASLGTSR